MTNSNLKNHPQFKSLYNKLAKVNAANTRKMNQLELAIKSKKIALGLKGGRRTKRSKRSNRTRRHR
jgi:hypothetical protein